ncbi:MAG: hypothetical protein DI639_08055 [Leifsonia xyli]|nr:MAG: hypothetical protein DI639_08055 [Leifsonia xyli]
MPAVKNVLKHVSTETAGRKRKCWRNNTHVILKGELCLVVVEGPMDTTTYCAECARPMLERAQQELAAITARFVE